MSVSLAEATIYSETLIRGIQPDPIQTISEWADSEMVLPSWSSEPGRWRTSRTPYLREIMDCLSPSSVYRRVVFMKCAQIGGTECGKNWIGYTIHRAPTSMLIVEPTVDVAKKLSRQKLQPMLSEVQCLKGLVREPRERDSGNTMLAKEFIGGLIVLTGANSGVGLRFMSAQNLFLDEVDGYGYDVDGEGPPVSVAEKRTLTYGRSKIYLCSTPLLKERSVIEPEYEASDMRRFQVPCPYCKQYQILRWANLEWPKSEPKKAEYKCELCGKLIPEHFKTQMLEGGKWVAEKPEIEDIAGFHINALYAPYGWVNSWGHLAKEWSDIIHKKDRGREQTFTNTNLAETWAEEGERIEGEGIQGRKETYQAECPEGVLILTAAVDTQDDRLELEVIGWGMGEESWSIDYRRFYGDTTKWSVWQEVEEYLSGTWTHESGIAMGVRGVGVDTAGHRTKEAYEFVQKCRTVRVEGLKGGITRGLPLVGGASKSNIAKINLFSVGTDTAKDTIFSRLKIVDFGPGYMHFPNIDRYDAEYFAQLTAESRVPKYHKGVPIGTVYKKLRARNEVLDIRVYNMAILAILNPNLAGMKRKMDANARKKTDNPQDKRDPLPGKTTPGRRGSNFIKGWRR